MSALDQTNRSSLAAAWAAGSVPMLVLTAWMITGGHWDFLQTMNGAPYFSDTIFDAQGRAIMDGRLDIPPDIAGGEAIFRGGKAFVYFGVFPALLRIPALAVTHVLDGRLATISMLCAAVVLTVAAYRLNQTLRTAIRGRVAMARQEQAMTAMLIIAILGGPPLLLTAGFSIYHEAVLWGLALSIAAFDAVGRWQAQPTFQRLVVASILATLAMLTRQSVAVGPVVALLLIGGLRLWHAKRVSDESPLSLCRAAASVLIAACIPVAASTAFHYPRVGQLVGMDLERLAWVNSQHLDSTADNFFQHGPRHLPLTLSTYLRPVGIEPRPDFPWIDFPMSRLEASQKATPLPFVTVEPAPSIPWLSPALCALGVGALVYRWRRPRRPVREDRVWPLAAGGLAGATSVLIVPGVASRYAGDIFPLIAIGGIAGFHTLLLAMPRMTSWVRRLTVAGVSSAVVLGLVVTTALTIQLQRERWFNVPTGWREELVRWRLALPGNPTPSLRQRGEPLPKPIDGELLVVGDCDELYIGSNDTWVALKQATDPAGSPPPVTPENAHNCFA